MLSLFGISDRERNQIFQSGRELGREEGIQEGMNIKLQKSDELTKEEYDKLMKYLVDNGIEISYSYSFKDRFSCGLIVRKTR